MRRSDRHVAPLRKISVSVLDGAIRQIRIGFVMPPNDLRWIGRIDAVQKIAGFVAGARDPEFVFPAEFRADFRQGRLRRGPASGVEKFDEGSFANGDNTPAGSGRVVVIAKLPSAGSAVSPPSACGRARKVPRASSATRRPCSYKLAALFDQVRPASATVFARLGVFF